MKKPDYVYVTYISTTPEKLWAALIDSEMTKQYWGVKKNVSDWKVGSPWEHQDYDIWISAPAREGFWSRQEGETWS